MDLSSNAALHTALTSTSSLTRDAEVLLLEVNVVLAAHRGDHPQHDELRRRPDAA